MNGRFKSGAIYQTKVDGSLHILSEDYFYKTEAYYTLVSNEVKGVRTVPSSTAVLEAYIVPVCLEKAKLHGIKVPEWGVSNSYAPTPCLIYGMNYYSTPSEYYRVDDLDSAKKEINALCHGDKYTFMFQSISPEARVSTHLSIYGEVGTDDARIGRMARRIFEIYGIPVVNMVLIENNDELLLSSLSPVRYSKLNMREKQLLKEHMSQEGIHG